MHVINIFMMHVTSIACATSVACMRCSIYGKLLSTALLYAYERALCWCRRASKMDDIVYAAGIIYTVLNIVAVLVCLLAVILVFGFRLYRKVVYRLALYQVLASLALAIMDILETVTFINYNSNPKLYDRLCKAIGWFGLYSQWVKLLFTMWVTFHVVCFAVLHKNLTKFEMLYVVTSLLVPAVIASVPLITNTYQYSIGTCYIYAPNNTNNIDLIENAALWDVPAMSILLVSSTAMVVMVIKLAHRVCWRKRYEPLTQGDRFWKALKQVLPLAAFPVLFFVSVIPILILDVYSAKSKPDNALLFSASIFIPLWSLSSGVTLIVHISVAQLYGRRRGHNDANNNGETGDVTSVQKTTPFLHSESATRFSLPLDSLT